jgi:RNA polymerase sigma-70 factor (ECF subfamily)
LEQQINFELIINGCKQNNLQSQEALYKSCYPAMMKICLRWCANRDDAAALYNQAMLKVFSSLHTYTDEGRLLSWIRTVMINTCIDSTRQKAVYNSGMQLTEEFDAVVYVEPEAAGNISAKEILALVQALPANLRTVFNLYAIEGYTHEQVGTMLGIPAGTSKWYAAEARKLLKQKLEKTLAPVKSFL